MSHENDKYNSDPSYNSAFGEWLRKPKVLLYLLPVVFILGLYIWVLLQQPDFNLFSIKKENLLHIIHLSLILIAIITILIVKYTKFTIYDEEQKNIEQAEKEEEIWYYLTLSSKIEKTPDYVNKKQFKNPDRLNKWINNKKKANTVITQFLVAWSLCLVGWFLLYIVLIIFSPTPNAFYNSFHNAIYNGFNNFSSLMFILMFLTLNSKTTDNLKLIGVGILGGVVFLLISLAEANSVEQFKYQAPFIFSLVSGLLASISMAAFFGRLNSRFKRIPIIIIFCLHLYAAIQVLFVFQKDAIFMFLFDIDIQSYMILPDQCDKPPAPICKLMYMPEDKFDFFKQMIENISTFMYGTAFFIKIILLLVVAWILNTARFSFFVVQEVSVFNANENDKLLKKFTKIIDLERKRII